jgi:hypothetical protein
MAGEMTLETLARLLAHEWCDPPIGLRSSEAAARAIVLRIAEWLDEAEWHGLGVNQHYRSGFFTGTSRVADQLRALADPAGRGE